jgi:hypothetical protein
MEVTNQINAKVQDKFIDMIRWLCIMNRRELVEIMSELVIINTK